MAIQKRPHGNASVTGGDDVIPEHDMDSGAPITEGLPRTASLFHRMSDGPTDTDFSIVDPQVEAALRICANPGFENNGCAFPSVIGQRYENSRGTFLANRVDFFHDAYLPSRGVRC
jgi:hypothetical protein